MSNEELQKNFFKKQIKRLEDRLFYHKMKDHWTKEDFDYADEMELELSILKEKLVKKEDENNGNNN